MVNLGNISVADLRLGAARVKAAYLDGRQVWGLGPVTPQYDVQSIGRSVSQQGASVEISEQAGETITLYIRTNAEDLAGKQVCAAVYLDSADVTPYATFAFGNVSLAGGYIEGTTPDVSTWLPNGFPQTYSTLYMKTWIQDAGYVDPADALGTVLDWTAQAAAPAAAEPLRFEALAADSSVVLSYGGSDSQYTAPSLEYSTDGQSWSEYQLGQAVALQSPGDYVMMRATASNRFSTSRTDYFKFSGAGQLRASGDATTLLEPDGSVLSAPDTVFHKLFQDCAMLKDVADLKLPSLSVGQESYNNMFNGAGISATPELPATALGANCYGNMFQTCRSLVKASDLPAGQLVQYCYQGMYQECTALRDGPRIMATSSTDNNQLDYMFYHTSNLSSVEVHFTTWPSATQWMSGIQTRPGEFRCPAALPDVRGTSNIPSGWTKVDVA